MNYFYSHYDKNSGEDTGKILIQHLIETARTARNYILAVPESVADREEMADLIFIIGLAHDFGKYTSFFQDYLLNGSDHGAKKNHSLLSALWSMYVLLQKWQGERIDKPTAMLLGFACIRSHHGDLVDISDDLQQFLQFKCSTLRDEMNVTQRRALKSLFEHQLPDIVKNAKVIQDEWREHNLDLLPINDFTTALLIQDSDFWKIFKQTTMTYELWKKHKSCDRFQRWLYLLFSSLIDADKRDAAQVEKIVQRFSIPKDSVERFKSGNDFGDVNPELVRLRESLYLMLEQKVKTLSLQQRILTLTAPTGSAKTLAALNFAIKLRKRIKDDLGYTPRIIYTLPFTSIIDQNYEVIDRVLSTIDGYKENPAVRLIKHHHLAEVLPERYSLGDEYPLDKLMMLVESWESEIIVTTFVQLFETLIGRRNKMIKKYHNLYGAILLLDEVQNVPVEYWRLIRKTMKEVADHLKCTIILMTATQPLIFQPSEVVELVDEPQHLFAGLDRIRFTYNPKKQSLESFVDSFIKGLDPKKSCAVILNTIRSSLDIYKLLSGLSTHQLYYLSTNIIPKHRVQRVIEIQKKLRMGETVLLVSTQVIEAGIDFDFDLVYRDMAPIDSIVQAAGRANRNAVGDKGEVCVVRLVNEQQREFASWIYSPASLWVAQELLKDRNELSESDFYKLVKENYEVLVQKTDQAVGEEIYVQWRNKCDFKALERFQLIKNDPNYVDIFLPIDEEAEDIWNCYQNNVVHEKDFSKRKNFYLCLRADFKKYVISVPIKSTKRFFWDYCRNDMKKIGYIAPDRIHDYYDYKTGFKRDYDDETMIF